MNQDQGSNANIEQAILAIAAALQSLIVTSYSNAYKFRAWRSTSFSATSGAFAVVTFNNVTFNTSGDYSTSTGRFTATKAGYYWFHGNITDDNGANTIYIPSLFKNGTEYARGIDIRVSQVSRSAGAQGLIYLAVGDYVDFRIYADTSTPIDISGEHASYFSGFMVSQV